jgi:hypothetical protein
MARPAGEVVLGAAVVLFRGRRRAMLGGAVK